MPFDLRPKIVYTFLSWKDKEVSKKKIYRMIVPRYFIAQEVDYLDY